MTESEKDEAIKEMKDALEMVAAKLEGIRHGIEGFSRVEEGQILLAIKKVLP